MLLAGFNKWLAQNDHPGLTVIDAGFRIAGTGSIGVKRYLLLLRKNNNAGSEMLMDMKEALPPAPHNYISIVQPAWPNEASRIIGVQEMVQHVSPAFLSSFQYNNKWFVMRALQPTADKVNLEQAIRQPSQLNDYLASLGMLTASGQLRSSGRKTAATADDLQAFAASAEWQPMLTDWSAAYAVQLEQEYKVYRKAWKAGYFKT